METERDAVKGFGTLLTRVMSMMNKVIGRSMASLFGFLGLVQHAMTADIFRFIMSFTKARRSGELYI